MLEWLLDPQKLRALRDNVLASAKRGDRGQVARAEAAVRADPQRIAFDANGTARVSGPDQSYAAGRFETPTIRELQTRAAACASTRAAAELRFAVVLGADPVTDIGALQATASAGTLFQVASQFNCLEAPGPYLTAIADYFHDSTQGPRAAVSAFPGALVRHYSAPSGDGTRFVQSGARQINLLADAVPGSIAEVKSGYLRSHDVKDIPSLARALQDGFDAIRVGVHDDVQVVLGYDWDGAVDGDRRIAQVLTSTYASGYSNRGALGGHEETICRQLLRAANLGTLLAAVGLGKRTVVLTAIGGGCVCQPASPDLGLDSLGPRPRGAASSGTARGDPQRPDVRGVERRPSRRSPTAKRMSRHVPSREGRGRGRNTPMSAEATCSCTVERRSLGMPGILGGSCHRFRKVMR